MSSNKRKPIRLEDLKEEDYEQGSDSKSNEGQRILSSCAK